MIVTEKKLKTNEWRTFRVTNSSEPLQKKKKKRYIEIWLHLIRWPLLLVTWDGGRCGHRGKTLSSWWTSDDRVAAYEQRAVWWRACVSSRCCSWKKPTANSQIPCSWPGREKAGCEEKQKELSHANVHVVLDAFYTQS